MQETATKTPLSIRDTLQSISVITQDSLKARQVIDIRQALETSAGITLFSGTGPFAGFRSKLWSARHQAATLSRPR